MGRTRKPAAATSRVVPRLLRLLGARGVDVAAVVAGLGLPAGAESAEEVPLTPDDFETLLGQSVRALGDPLLAVRLPDLLEWPSYHIGELAARASPTLREAFDNVARYASLFYAHLHFACVERGGELIVSHRLRSGGPGGRYGNEYALASTLAHARRLSGATVAPRRVTFAHRAPPEVEGLRRHFGTRDVRFDGAENALAFAAEDAARPSLGHDARLLATATALADRALRERPPTADFVTALLAELRRALGTGSLGAAAVARRLGMSERTLQRRIEEQGTSFSALAQRVRKEVALDAVNDPALPLAEAALRAGFSDAATFGRAFKRWTGRSPGAYRKGTGSR